MPDIGPVELLISLAIVMLVFGPSKLADLGGALGKSVKSFKTAVEDDKADEDDTPAAAAAQPVLAQQKCPSCETENAASALFCRECGASLAVQPAVAPQTCPSCETENTATALFCRECGGSLAVKTVEHETAPEPAVSLT